MTAIEKKKAIQRVLGVEDDGKWGPMSQGALDALLHPELKQKDAAVHAVRASSFADPKDIAAFKKCKSAGGTDNACFKVGDNGIGYWGDSTAKGSGPQCALPREDWADLDEPRGTKVEVTANGKTVVCRMGDTMPARGKITNGAGIDLNPDACEALGLKPPVMIPATWRYI